MQLYNATITQPFNATIMQPCNATITQPCNATITSMYPFLWDVTILEYAVSMHNKKGEISRKKKALETISQLEINTNNNEEILREAQAA
jgi:hypothetical protein